ncbi:MAG: hypothetical protein WC551_07725 [Patescibacteria group bacterium]
MAIPFVKAGGWAYREKLTSVQMNTLQTYLNSRAADLATGETNSFGSVVEFNGAATFNAPVVFATNVSFHTSRVTYLNSAYAELRYANLQDVPTSHFGIVSAELVRVGVVSQTTSAILDNDATDTYGAIEFSCRAANPGYPVFIKDAALANMVTLGWTTGMYLYAKMVWDGSVWRFWTGEVKT